jgi:hypothetical protein
MACETTKPAKERQKSRHKNAEQTAGLGLKS